MLDYDELILHFRLQPYYQEAEAYQVSIRRSPGWHLGGAWLRSGSEQSPDDNHLTLEWARRIRRDYQDYMTRYWETAQDTKLRRISLPSALPQHKLVALGAEMFQALPWSVRKVIRTGVFQARQRSRGLRIVMEFEEGVGLPSELDSLPWELLYDPENKAFLALTSPVSLVRRVPEIQSVRLLSLKPPIRLLAVAASPTSFPVSLDGEAESFCQLVRDAGSGVELKQISGADTISQMVAELSCSSFDCVILIAHGDLALNAERGYVLLEDAQRQTLRVSFEDLRLVLGNALGLQLAVLSVCHSGKVLSPALSQREKADTPVQADLSIACDLMRDGLPAVVVMQDRIAISANRLFLNALVCGLGRGCSVDEAVYQGRQAVRLAQDSVNWSVPVLTIQAQLPAPAPWYDRLADGLADWFWRPEATSVTIGTLGVALLWSLANWVMGMGQTRPWPPVSLPVSSSLALLAGLLCLPYLMALLHRASDPNVQRLSWPMQLVYQVQGANIGMLVGASSAMLAISLIYYSPIWLLLPEPAQLILVMLALGWAALMGYSQVRAIPQAMTVNAHVRAPRLTGLDIPIMIGWPCVLLGLLFLGLILSEVWPKPALASALLAAILLALMLALKREKH